MSFCRFHILEGEFPKKMRVTQKKKRKLDRFRQTDIRSGACLMGECEEGNPFVRDAISRPSFQL